MGYAMRNSIGRAAVPRPTLEMGATPSIPGTNRAFGAVLTALPPVFNGRGVNVTYQWVRGTATIANATNATYAVASADSGLALTAFVSASNLHGSKIVSARTSAITLA